MNSPKTLTVKLYGNLGGDPKVKHTPEVLTYAVYDAVLDQPVEREVRRPSRELRVFSLAVNAKDEAGTPLPTRWHRCVDWQGYTASFRQGDYVVLSGFFKNRRYFQDGELKSLRQFVVTAARLLHAKHQGQAA